MGILIAIAIEIPIFILTMKNSIQNNIEYYQGKIRTELFEATKKFGPFATTHEGYAVILEEMDELWDAIKDKEKGMAELEKEAIQVGAMALRFLIDICTKG